MKLEKIEMTIEEILKLDYISEDDVYGVNELNMFNMLHSIYSYNSDFEIQNLFKERDYVKDYSNDGRSRQVKILLYKDRPFAIYQYIGRGNVENEQVFDVNVYKELIKDYIAEYVAKELSKEIKIADINSPYTMRNSNMAHFEIKENKIYSYK